MELNTWGAIQTTTVPKALRLLVRQLHYKKEGSEKAG